MMDMEGLDNCSICMDSYDEKLRPRNLPCGHTFCTCIIITIKEGRIECPHCKVPHRALTARDFPVNFIAEAMISKFREAKLEAALKDNPESVLSATGTQLEPRKMQNIINALKESLRSVTEVAKTTKNESEKYKKCIGKKIAQHRDQMTEIVRILQIHKDIVNELEETEQKLTKYSEEQELCLAAISNFISKLDYTNESYDGLIVCEKLVKLEGTIANLILRGDVINSIFAKLIQSLDKDNMVAFMDLNIDGWTKGRIHISLSPQTPLATHFWKRCTGEMGPCYVHTKFLRVLRKGHYDESVVAGDYEKGDGSGGAPLFTGLENQSTVYSRRSESGSIGTVEDQNDGPRSAQFVICTRTRTHSRNVIFVLVQNGLDLVKGAIKCNFITKIHIEDCGIVLPFEY